MHIALISSSASQAQFISKAMQGYQCSWLTTKPYATDDSVDLFIVDISTISADNAQSALQLAQARSTPTLLIASTAQQDAILNALQHGAQDYMFTPLGKSALVARVRILLQQHYPNHDTHQHYRFGDFVFETPSLRVSRAGTDIVLTQKEFALALLLLNHLGHPLSRAYIQEAIWGHQSDVPTRTIDTHISRVRNKLQLDPAHGYQLSPVYGFGYQLASIP